MHRLNLVKLIFFSMEYIYYSGNGEKKFFDIKPAEAGTGVYIAFFVKKMHF